MFPTAPKLGRRLRQCATCQHAYQMRAVFWASVDIAVHSGCWNGHPLDRLGRKALLQRLFERFHAKHAVRSSTGYRYADVGAALGHKYPHERKARSRMLELFVGCLLGDRKTHLGDNLAVFQSCLLYTSPSPRD